MGEASLPDPDRSIRFDTYKLLVEMADRVSQRRQAANNFYLSVNTAIIGTSAYLSAFHSVWEAISIVSVAGFCVSLLWIRNIKSYKELNEGKFHIITELEKTLPVQAYADEWVYLHKDGRQNRYTPFHTVEVLVPWVFVVVHSIQFLTSFDWASVPGWFVQASCLFHCL